MSDYAHYSVENKELSYKIFYAIIALEIFVFFLTEFLIPLIKHNILIILSCQAKIHIFYHIQE